MSNIKFSYTDPLAGTQMGDMGAMGAEDIVLLESFKPGVMAALCVTNRKKLMRELTVLLASKTPAEWQTLMEAQDIICGPIADYDMAMESPQLKKNGLIADTANAIER